MKASQKIFFITSLLLPLLVPAIAFLFQNTVAVVFQLSASFGAIPYLIFVSGVFVWMKGKSASEVLKISWWLPVIFVPVFGVYILIYHFSREWVSASDVTFFDAVSLLIGYSLYVLVIGYFYVVVVNLLYRGFHRVGLLGK